MSASLKLRLISGFTLGPLTLAVIWFGGVPFLALMIIAFAVAVHELRDMTKISLNPLRDFLTGLFYLLICFGAFIAIRLGSDLGVVYVLALIVTIWACDVGAYFSGKLIGGARLAPLISPNKTWAGLIGGALSSGLLMMVIFVAFMVFVFGNDLFDAGQNLEPIVNVFSMGAVLAVVGQIGDLMMSWYKRKVGVKDTGTIIPGHGGILDRIDSLLLASPVYLILLVYFLG